MVMRQTIECDNCGGSGEALNPRDKCKTCQGKKTVVENKILMVDIEKGMKEGKKIVFKGESNEEPGHVTGDVIFVVKEQQHDVFHRDGIHLFIERTIPLVSALTGFSFTVKHLDGSILYISTEPGEIIKNDDLREVPDKGMPIHGSPFSRGSLFVKFSVEFPESLTKEERAALKQCFTSKSEKRPAGEDVVDVVLQPVGLHSASGGGGRGYSAYDESSSDDQQQGGVTCQQQ